MPVYNEKVMEHFMNPRNVGEIENPDGIGEHGSIACGDAMRFTFRVEREGELHGVAHRDGGAARDWMASRARHCRSRRAPSNIATQSRLWCPRCGTSGDPLDQW